MGVRLKRAALAFLLAAALLLLAGCGEQRQPDQPAQATPTPSPTPFIPRITPTPQPRLSAKSAGLLGGVETSELVVSIVFEGATDDAVMDSIFSALHKQDVDGIFFIDGTTAYERPELLKQIAEAEYTIGNAGMTLSSRMDLNTAAGNVHQFERTQSLIRSACGLTPEYVCLSGANYTTELLQAVTASGLKGAVQPDIFINRDSFLEAEEDETVVASLVRGSVISIQLGSAKGNYETATQGLAESKSIDPASTINDENVEARPDLRIVEILTWLLDAFKLNHYTVVTPVELQDMRQSLLGDGVPLTAALSARYDIGRYTYPVTPANEPIGITVTRSAEKGDFSKTVFVGDSVMANLMSYVGWRRETAPDFWDDSTFLVSSKLTLEKALIGDEGSPALPMVGEQRVHIDDALWLLGAKRVYLCLRCENIRAYSEPRYLNNLKVLIYQIRQRCPEIEIIVMSVPPAIGARTGTPSNMQIFQYNLMVAEMCQSHSIIFLDTASALRNEKGDLRDEYCLDPDMYGTHLNDAGCQAYMNFISNNIP